MRTRPHRPAPVVLSPTFTRRAVLTGTVLAAVSATGMRLTGDIELALGGPTRDPAARAAADPRSISAVTGAGPRVTLTFDDGPDPAFTPRVLDILARHGAHATFFVVGANVHRHPALAQRIVEEGHTLGNHTYDHAPLSTLPDDVVRDQLARGRAAIEHLEHGPRLARPPSGFTSTRVARIAHSLGEREVFWGACVEAVHGGTPPQRGTRLAQELRGGDVVLAHDGGHVTGRWAQEYDRAPTVEALDALLSMLRQRDLTPVTLPELLAARTTRAL